MTAETKLATATSAETKPSASFFNLKTPLLAQGRLDNHVAKTDLMSVIVKVYASGGENAMHMHPYEDHAFIVMEGEATFHLDTDDNIKIVGKNEGIMLPKGCKYWFLSSSKENLVMLRIGASAAQQKNWRVHPDGSPFLPGSEGFHEANKDKERIDLPGQFFAG